MKYACVAATCAVIIACLLNIGCKPPAPVISSICASKDMSKYNKLAVLTFSDAPNAPQSGAIVSALVTQSLAKAGFTVVERGRLQDLLDEQKLSNSGLMEDGETIKLGKLMGVNAVVIGVVSQYSTNGRHTDTTYIDMVQPGPLQMVSAQDGTSHVVQGPDRVTHQAIQGVQWTESIVSISLRILDVESGQLLYAGSGQYDHAMTKPPQMLAEEIIRGIVFHLTTK